MSDTVLVERILDHYADNFSEQENLALLKALAYPSQGGEGYQIKMANPYFEIDGWEVDKAGKVISLDRTGMIFSHSTEDLVDYLRDAVEIGIMESRLSLAARIGWGTGKLVVGLVETGIGVVGIVVPEPGTTAGG